VSAGPLPASNTAGIDLATTPAPSADQLAPFQRAGAARRRGL
jgi:hypothetical protein